MNQQNIQTSGDENKRNVCRGKKAMMKWNGTKYLLLYGQKTTNFSGLFRHKVNGLTDETFKDEIIEIPCVRLKIIFDLTEKW